MGYTFLGIDKVTEKKYNEFILTFSTQSKKSVILCKQ